MSKYTVYHGSRKIIEQPVFGVGNPKNDYGLGFYCTMHYDLAAEWACGDDVDGFVNCFQLDTRGLRSLNLNAGKYTILHWLEVLVTHRTLRLSGDIAPLVFEYLRENFHVPVEDYDIVRGYRADDSYFAFASAFLGGSISLPKLQEAMKLGKLGEQIVPRTQEAYDRMEFLGADAVRSMEFYPSRAARDQKAREGFVSIRNQAAVLEEPRITDILREKWQPDDSRLK